MLDYNYDLAALDKACESVNVSLNEHTPLPSPNPKRVKDKDKRMQDSEISNENICNAIQAVLKRFDEQDNRL